MSILDRHREKPDKGVNKNPIISTSQAIPIISTSVRISYSNEEFCVRMNSARLPPLMNLISGSDINFNSMPRLAIRTLLIS